MGHVLVTSDPGAMDTLDWQLYGILLWSVTMGQVLVTSDPGDEMDTQS